MKVVEREYESFNVDQINNFDSSSLAITTYNPNTSLNIIQQQRTEDVIENSNLLNVLSRVTIALAKYPNDTTLYNYGDLQMWMYTHTNKHAPVDICEFLTRIFLIRSDHYDQQILFNLRLICAEAYQTIGSINQAQCQYDQAEMLASNLNNITEIITLHDKMIKDRQQKKLEDIGMKLEFQAEFKCNLIKGRKRSRLNSTYDDFLSQLNMDNPSPEKCRYIWRQIVLQFVLQPNIAIPSAHWLLSYAARLPSNSLQHANSLYVALNLFLFGYGSTIFQQQQHLNIDVFKMLDDIGRYFDENGNQSKQFSPIHKMAHVWGTAAVAFHLTSDIYQYLVCACMMRVSFESLNICFMSSGIESLYILARTHAPEFFTMMSNIPSIKLMSPECIKYIRRQVENNQTCIRYSTETVNRFVLDIFNIDQSEHRI
ncbi:unnamed protein product [Adineta steineri]|uniref:Uncharacterized protein n=1 Tax=Adineta steineri TaxID=433720 RepID=A0A815Q7S0_9BILA|nr:unnamed protein product [Adineta steineri]CAF1632869.1 unnamed protein product [Adineta steineri]